jgi:hypothetical protein
MKLSDEDGRAVDLLLDRQPTSPASSGTFVKSVDVQPQRVQTIQQILSVLKELPAEDPSPDLAIRTVHHVDAAIAALEAVNPAARPPPANRPEDRRPSL